MATCSLPRIFRFRCCFTHSVRFWVQTLGLCWADSSISTTTGKLRSLFLQSNSAAMVLILRRRWALWVLIIWSGALTIVFVAFIPETYAPVLARRRPQELENGHNPQAEKTAQDTSTKAILRTLASSCTRPFKLLTQEYMVTCLCLLTAILLGVQYLLFGAFSYAFSKVYNFDQSQIGLSFLGIGVGAIVAAVTFPVWNSTRCKQLAANNNVPEPEFRLPPAAFGAIMLPISLFWFGWTCRKSIHWICPIVGSGLFGVGGLLIFNGVWTFLVESYPTFAASALGANAFSRLVFAAAFPLFGVQSESSQ